MNKIFSLIALITLGTGIALAQTTSGDLVGIVKDVTGAAIPNAPVTVTNEDTGVANKTTANAEGQYRVSNLLPGTYDIEALAPGFKPLTVKHIVVDLNKTATADVTLGVSSSGEVVEVEANSGYVLDTTSQNLTTTFTSQQLGSLPVTSIGQGVINTSLLAPGVASQGGIGIGTGPSINGQRPRNNNFEIEGIDNNNKAVTGPLVQVPNDAVGDFTLITTQFSPEFGHSSGGQFNENIVSGTNKFHGRAYEYFQNRNLNAASGTAGHKIPNPRYDNNRYGGQIGGPIIKDKLFFFGNYERQSIGQSSSYYLCTPTASGFSELNGLATADNFNANNLAQFEKYVPAATVTGAGGTGIDAVNDAACGNQKTGAQFLSVSNATSANENGELGATTTNQIPLGNYLVNAPNFSNEYSITAAVDYTISNTDSLRFRYISNNLASEDIAASLPEFFLPIPTKNYLATISEFHTFTANLTNEFRLGFNRYTNTTPSGNFSYPGLDAFPNLTFYDQGFINVGPDGNAPQFTIQNLYQLTDNISYTHGKNTFKIGFDGRKYISPQGFTQRARGDYEYNITDEFLHDFASDSNGFSERSAGTHTYYGDQTALYGYANDTYRATPQLTFNLGLRYEFTSVPVGERTQSLNAISNVPGLITFGVPQPAYKNFAPRFGVEYAPDTKTSVRAGFGLAYDVLFDNLGTLSQPPQVQTTLDVGTSPAPAFGQANFLANGGLVGASGALSATDAKALTGAYIPNQVVPYAESYTLTIQRELGDGLTAEIGYVGDRGIHLPTQDQLNIQPETNATNNLFTTAGSTTLQAAGTNATNLAAIQASPTGIFVPAYYNAGFTSKITSYQPYSGSNYNGLIANLQGHLKNGLQLNLSYTFSKTMDDATAEVFATVLTPRRAQNSQDISADYSRSALDRTHRLTLEAVYDFKAFKGRNWFLQNLVANWVFSPIYTYESPEYITAFSGDNANIDGDSGAAIDRTIINPNGVKGTGSGVNPVLDGAGNTIGYTAVNPNAYYIQAGPGTLPNAARNTLALPVENNVDFSAYKRFTVHGYSIEVGAQAFNVLNHAQYIPGSVDDVAPRGYTASYNLQTVTNAFFNRPDTEFNNNARNVQLSAKFIF
jgi:hypothetical protein